MLIDLIKSLLRSPAARDRDELAMTQALIENSQYDAAISALGRIIERNPGQAHFWYLRGVTQSQLRRPELALADLTQADSLAPDNLEYQLELARCHRDMGNITLARLHAQRARALSPTHVPAFQLLALLELPGDNYLDVLSRIMAHRQPRTYVEIGIFEGASLRLATMAQAVLGIDPNPQVKETLPANTRVVQLKSDDFFAKHDMRASLGGRSVDVAFIDGMHWFEFALRDFANLERHCEPDSVILIHDCYPVDAECTQREPRDVNWTGDVWRLVVLLKKYRPDLSINTIGSAPSGLVVVQNLDPASTLLHDNEDRLIEEFMALDYSYLNDDKAGKLNLFPNDWEAIRQMIKPRASG
jgi:predicted O-methyltransferase YrrM